MTFIPRLRLYGKKATEETIIQEIYNLLHGAGRRPYPLPAGQIAKALGLSRSTVYNYIHKIPKHDISRLASGHYNFPKSSDAKFRFFNSHHDITSDPLVAERMDDLLTRKQGNPLKCWRQRLRSVEIVCNTCNVSPRQLMVSTKNTEKIMRSFAKMYQNGKIRQDPRGTPPQGMNTVIYNRVQGVRDFCAFYDITWKKGTTGIMSQKVPGHGKYADIRLTDSELAEADHFIKERWGFDSDVYRWFWIGVESCARFEALYNMSIDYTTHTNPKTGKTIYLMTVHESKAEHLRGGKWHKYITRPDTQKSIDCIKSRGYPGIHEMQNDSHFKQFISKSLCTIFQHLKKTNPYFFHHPTHALRHIGAQYWLARKDFNYGLVSEIGGWHTIDELKKSYGQIPPEKILEIIEN